MWTCLFFYPSLANSGKSRQQPDSPQRTVGFEGFLCQGFESANGFSPVASYSPPWRPAFGFVFCGKVDVLAMSHDAMSVPRKRFCVIVVIVSET